MEEPTSYQINAAQIAAYASKIKRSIDRDVSNDPNSQLERVARISQEHAQKSGSSVAEWKPIQDGDPPISGLINGFMSDIELDSLILNEQLDILEASAIELYNSVKTDVLKAVSENARLANKLKTLQLYSSASDQSVVVFGDSFLSDELVDKVGFSGLATGDIDGSGVLTLARKDIAKNLMAKAEFKILPTSNGIPGNNHELVPDLADKDNKEPEFIGTEERYADPKAILDQLPTTWFEYESISISEEDKKKASFFNFEFVDDMKLKSTGTSTAVPNIKWGSGPTGGKLALDFEIKIKTPSVINALTFFAQEFKDRNNPPLRISSVMVSPDGGTWNTLTPEDVWLTNDANLDNIVKASNLAIGAAKWKFEPQLVSYIRVSIVQDTPIDVVIGHTYYETKVEKKFVTKEKTGANGSKVKVSEEVITPAHRTAGPIPPVSNPFKYNISNPYIGNLTMGLDVFNAKRHLIAVRDVAIGEVSYEAKSTIVSKKFQIQGVVDRVVLEADIEIPDTYSDSEEWVKFFISPDDGVTWRQISRVEDVYNDVPEIIAFNDPLPVEFREPNIGYITTSGTVNSLRVKIEVSRPADQPSSTPIVNGYKLKIRKQD